MSPLRAVLHDSLEAMRAFTRPARLFLLAEFLAWTGHGVFQVLFNLYLVQGGYRESFVGHAVSLSGIGMALAALPAGLLADRWGRRRCLLLGATLEGVSALARATLLAPSPVLAASFTAGVGQAMLAIASAPFITENSGARERTHLFSSYFAAALLAGVIGSILGGWVPAVVRHLPGIALDTMGTYRVALVLGALLILSAAIPLARIGGREAPIARDPARVDRAARGKLVPIAVNSLLIGAGAGLVIPFMNLYFSTRFGCTSDRIGLIFSIAQVLTALAALLGPAFARRFGKLRTAVAAELLSLPFLITLGVESRLPVAVVAFWLRATLMQASTPLVQAFVMEALPPELRARSTSLNNMVWNAGWAVSATLAGMIIQRFGYHVPFYITAVLYATAASYFYLSFRGTRNGEAAVRLSEEAKGNRGEGTFTE